MILALSHKLCEFLYYLAALPSVKGGQDDDY